jgi:hypothetical protein
MLVKCNLALAIETLVLIAAIFLYIHINKNQLSKWFRYAGIAIIVFVLGLILCSMLACCRMCCHRGMGGMERDGRGMGDGPRMEMMYMHQGMMGDCSEGRGECSEGKRMFRHGRMGHGRMGMGYGSHCMEGGSCEMSGKCEMGEKEECCEGKMEKGKCEMGGKEECCRASKADSVKKALTVKKK